MARKLAILILLIPVWVAPPAAAQPVVDAAVRDGAIHAAADLAFTGVHVVDVASGSVLPDQTVVIAGNRIAAVGPAAGVHVPMQAQVVEAKGLYLIPGLWDMHVHSWEEAFMRDVFLPLYVAHGVTGIRELGGQPFNLEQRAAITAGTLVGPRMVVGSPLVDGPNPTFPERSVRVANAGEAHRAVDSLLAEGYDFVKTYKFLSPEAYRALHERGREVGMEISGEIPISVSLWEAADLGHRTVEHLTGVEIACSSREEDLRLEYRSRAEEISADTTLRTHLPVWIRTEWEPIASVDLEKCATLYRHLAAHGTWVVPTLMIQRLISFHADPDLRDHPGKRYLPAGVWDPEANADFFDPERQLRPTYEYRLRTLPDLHRAGVGILAGTDVPAGFTLHDELALYVQSGLTAPEALRTATLNPARYLGRTDDLGTVAPGRLADLVLLDANPLEDIRNTQRISAVVADGRYFDRLALDELLAGVELAARESVVHVAPPTGETEADRASILAALAQVTAGGTVQFAAGTYLVGEIISVRVPEVSLLGHPEGTTLRGCEWEDFQDMDQTMLACNGLELAGVRQTVRGITFENAFWALHLGCCWSERRMYEWTDGSTFEGPVFRRTEGGHLVENNTFRSAASGVRVNGDWTEPAIVRNNRFVDNWHAVSINGNTVHLLDNHISVPEPERVPFFGFPWDGVKISPHPPVLGDEGFPAQCVGNVVAGNRIEGHLDGIRIEVYFPGTLCRDNIVRDNTVVVRRVRNPLLVPGFVLLDESDSTFVGVPISILNDPMAFGEATPGNESVIEGNVIERNRIVGGEGVGVLVLHASRNRIADNEIIGIVPRDPFPGNAMGTWGAKGLAPPWADANGAGIWASPGSDENEIVGNVFEDVAGDAVVLEGDRNRIETRSADDAVRDRGRGNRTSIRSIEGGQ